MSGAYVLFPVPSARVPEVAVFLYASGASLPEAIEAPARTAVAPMSTDEREALLTRIYDESEPPFRRLMMLAAKRDDPTSPVSFRDVSQDMGLSTTRSLPGVLGAFGRRTKHRYGGYSPLRRRWDPAAGSWFMSMEAEVAAFLRALHAKRDSPLR